MVRRQIQVFVILSCCRISRSTNTDGKMRFLLGGRQHIQNLSALCFRICSEFCIRHEYNEFITAKPKQFEERIVEGASNVSGGQKQRLSIARAIVRHPQIYIYDDSFSALDFATDAKLRKALKGYTEDATVLIVAQRVSTIMHAEQIVVLDEGKVVGIGTHEQLLKECSTYREIAQSQLSKEELA